MTSGSVLVLRPQPGADETVAHLASHGIAARACPVLAIEALAITAAQRALVQRLDEFDVIIFVSPGAVRIALPWLEEYWPQFPSNLSWLAVGARSRDELVARQLPALAPADERTEGLLQLAPLAAPHLDKVLIVRGEGGREAMAAALAERGARVEHLVVYRRSPVRVALPDPRWVSAIIATSAEVVDAFVATGGDAFQDHLLLVPSQRVADHAQTVGFAHVRVMAGADAEASRLALAQSGIVGGGASTEGEQQ